jgi:hypothetical protein
MKRLLSVNICHHSGRNRGPSYKFCGISLQKGIQKLHVLLNFRGKLQFLRVRHQKILAAFDVRKPWKT